MATGGISPIPDQEHLAKLVQGQTHSLTGSDEGEPIDHRLVKFSLTVDEAFELGRVTNRLRMGAVIGTDPGGGG